MEVPKPVRMGYEGKQAAADSALGEDLWELHAAGTKLLEVTAGRGEEEFGTSEVLRAAVEMMLGIMALAARRIEAQSEEMATRLNGLAELHRASQKLKDSDADDFNWRFVVERLPELVASAAEELRKWHEG